MTFQIANLAMKLARISNIVFLALMVLCFVYNEANLFGTGYYDIQIHNSSIFFMLLNTCIILFRIMMSFIQVNYDASWFGRAILEFMIAVIFSFMVISTVYILLLPIDGIRNKVLGTLLFNISLTAFYLRSQTLHSWKDM